MNKNILLGLVVIIAAAGAAYVGSTGAFFSDTETSTGNSFTAGDIDLKIGNESYVTNGAGTLVASASTSWSIADLTNQLFFNFSDVKPGDVGEDTIAVRAGTNDAYACMAAKITATPENTLTGPEVAANDVGPASGNNGELQNYLNFVFWNDDGDNVFETGESQITALSGTAGTVFNGAWSQVGTSTIAGNSTRYVAKAWCFGGITPTPIAQDGTGHTAGATNGPLVRGTGFSCDASGNQNAAQTDGISVDVSFQAVQARNNANFTCSSLPALTGTTTTTTVVHQADLFATNASHAAGAGNKWFFYDDSADTSMTIDQFSGTGGQDHMEAVAGSDGAKMKLDSGGNARYNIATFKYTNLLSAINTLKWRVYDATADSDVPFLGFNVDFATSTITGYQNRLTMQPGTGGNPALPTATWTVVDAINSGSAMWTWSGFAKGPDKVTATADDNRWPDGNTNAYRTWASIVAAFPNAKILTAEPFLGVRTGQPGPTGATNFVDYIQLNGETNDFTI